MEFPKGADMKPPKGTIFSFGGALLELVFHKSKIKLISRWIIRQWRKQFPF
jgi:hypothetical protein